MRLGQGLPVNMIVLTALALLVLVVVGAFFISGFGQAGGSVSIVEADQSACNGRCQSMVASGFSLPECPDVEALGSYSNDQSTGFADMGCADAYGPCYVTVQGGVTCVCDDDGCLQRGVTGGEVPVGECTVATDCGTNYCGTAAGDEDTRYYWGCAAGTCNLYSETCSGGCLAGVCQ